MESIGSFFCNLKKIISDNAAIIIAFLALFVSIYENYRGRKHDKLSVRPQIDFRSDRDVISNEIKISIKNFGFGPAKIIDLNLFVNKEKIQFTNFQMVEKLFEKQGLDGKYINRTSFAYPAFISSGGEETILSINPRAPENEKVKFKEFISKSTFKIQYCSFYDENFFTEYKFPS